MLVSVAEPMPVCAQYCDYDVLLDLADIDMFEDALLMKRPKQLVVSSGNSAWPLHSLAPASEVPKNV